MNLSDENIVVIASLFRDLLVDRKMSDQDKVKTAIDFLKEHSMKSDEEDDCVMKMEDEW